MNRLVPVPRRAGAAAVALAVDAARAVKHAIKRVTFAVLPTRLLVGVICFKMPRSAQLEVTTACNLHCPLCTTHTAPRERRQLVQQNIDNVAESCGHRLKVVNLHLLGEPLLNPDLFKMVRRCESAGIRTTFSTNGMLLGRHIDEVIDSGLTYLSIAIDGATAEDYARYRIGGNLDTVVRNTKQLMEARRARGVNHPVVQVQMVMFSYNEDKEREARAFLETLGADVVSFKRPSYEVEAEIGAAKDFLEKVDRDAHRRYARPVGEPSKLYRNQRMCPQLERATVLSDGRVVACCMDAIGTTSFGNVNDTSFKTLWRSDAHRALVTSFMHHELEPCGHCTLGYRDLDDDPPPLDPPAAQPA